MVSALCVGGTFGNSGLQQLLGVKMDSNDLEKLNTAVGFLIDQETFRKIIEQLSKEIDHSQEPFVWSVVDLNSIDRELPANIRSCWIFVLKKDVSSGCHYHPNSIQHMVAVKGQGMSKVGDISKRIVQFDSANHSLSDIWYVIGTGVPHEFFPEEKDMVVVSFHTCEANELEEVACETGERRLYEGEICTSD
jgi:mannose-6-phosphate isomerase-like protein (cupin superfamily)